MKCTEMLNAWAGRDSEVLEVSARISGSYQGATATTMASGSVNVSAHVAYDRKSVKKVWIEKVVDIESYHDRYPGGHYTDIVSVDDPDGLSRIAALLGVTATDASDRANEIAAKLAERFRLFGSSAFDKFNEWLYTNRIEYKK